MLNIEQIKTTAFNESLISAIYERVGRLRAFGDKNGWKYGSDETRGLGREIDKAQEYLDEMRTLLAEIKKTKPNAN